MWRRVLLIAFLLTTACNRAANPSTSATSTDSVLPRTATICSESITGECWSSSEIAILPASGGAPRILHLPPAQYSDIAWSPDGKSLAVIVNNQALEILDLDSLGTTTVASVDGPNSVATPAWSPDGSKLAYTLVSGWTSNGHVGGAGAARDTALAAANHLHLMVVPADGGEPLEIASGKSPSWSPDGARIAFTSAEGRVESISPDGSDSPSKIGWGDNATWSPDGRTLLFEQFGDGFMDIYSAPSTGGNQRTVVHGGAVPRLSTTGALAYLEGNLFGRPTVSDADGKSASTISSREASWIAWSPDGRALAVTFIQPREPTAADFPPAPTRPGHPAPSDNPKENGGSPAADIPTVDVGRP